MRCERGAEEYFEVSIPRAALESNNPGVTWEQLRELLPLILEQLHADEDLAILAAINPLYALEELGYEIDPQARLNIEDRLRFGPRGAVKLRRLRKTIFEHAGREFDINSSSDLEKILFEELSLRIPQKRQGKRRQEPIESVKIEPLPPQLSWTKKRKDPLEKLRGEHPIIEPLLEYRRLMASRPQLAPRDLYEKLREKKRHLPVFRMRGRLKNQPR